MKKFDLHANLSNSFLDWRVGGYLLSKPIYFSLSNECEDLAFVTAQFRGDRLFILDVRYESESILKYLLKEINYWAIKNSIAEIQIQSSDKYMLEFISNFSQIKRKKVFNCYFFCRNKKIDLNQLKILITPISSDIFLR